MLLQDSVLCDGSTRAARAWKCVAGKNILPTEQQTNFSQVDIPLVAGDKLGIGCLP
jgi:hypothetical protein